MQMHDEISHLCVVDGLLRLRFPGAVGRRVIRKHADHLDFRQVLEFDAVDLRELAAENEMQQLLGRLVGHSHYLNESQKMGRSNYDIFPRRSRISPISAAWR